MNDWATLKSHAQKCLNEVSWNTWSIDTFLGQGAWSFAMLLKKGKRECVLLLTNPNITPMNKPDVLGFLPLYQSAANIRIHCRHVGLPVAKTIARPQAWSGGACVLLSRVAGKDLEHSLQNSNIDAYKIGVRVAHMVRASQVLGTAHHKHHQGFGNHIFGMRPRHNSNALAWSTCISTLVDVNEKTNLVIEQLRIMAEQVLEDAPKTTQIWDVGDRNIMLDDNGDVVGLVDQVDLFTGDECFVAGFSWAMLGDVHNWSKIDDYTQAWRHTWNMTEEQILRTRMYRLACFGRFIGKQVHQLSKPVLTHNEQQEALNRWNDCAQKILSEGHG